MSLAGSFLVARHVLRDPNFARTVVLLLAHNEDGAFGLVVNRPATAEGLPFPLFVGGPCPSPGLLMLHGHADWVEEADESEGAGRELAPGGVVGGADALRRATGPDPGGGACWRGVRGYAGWA